MHRHCPIPEVFDGGHSTFLHTWTVLPSIRNQKVCNKFVARFLNVLPSIRNQKVSNKLMCAKFSCGVAGCRVSYSSVSYHHRRKASLAEIDCEFVCFEESIIGAS